MSKPKCKAIEEKSGMNKVGPEILLKLETQFKQFLKTPSDSLLKKHLSQNIFDSIKNLKTSFNATLLDCVQSGFQNPDSHVGIYAPDPEAYDVFKPIFDPIIEEYHDFKKNDKHPSTNFGDVSTIINVDPKNEFVISTRVRCGRSVKGFPFNPILTEEQYKCLEDIIECTLKHFTGDLKGEYHPLKDMDKQYQNDLIENHYLFKEGDRFLQAANTLRFWPIGRGIFFNNQKTFLVWVGEEDHMRIISMQNGGDLGEVYKRFVNGVTEIESKIPCLKHERLGYFSFCPTNLGTSVRASVLIKLPKLTKNMKKLNDLADKYQLQIRGSSGEHTESTDGIYDISNKRRLGLTEYEAIKQMQDGVIEIIKQERVCPLERKR